LEVAVISDTFLRESATITIYHDKKAEAITAHVCGAFVWVPAFFDLMATLVEVCVIDVNCARVSISAICSCQYFFIFFSQRIIVFVDELKWGTEKSERPK
jgi:hypothetical protein